MHYGVYMMDKKELTYDRLTGLMDMASFQSEAALKVQENPETRFSVAFIDIDNLKKVNRKYGMRGGDNLLRYTAGMLKSYFPDHLLSRFGDDHFCVLGKEENLEHGLKVLDMTLHTYDEQVRIAIKAGIYTIHPGDSLLVACDNAREACESIKPYFDKVFTWYDENKAAANSIHQYVIENVDNAIKNGWIVVYYQPVVRILTKRLSSFEALARWNDPKLGLLSPAHFIEALEEARLIHKVDLYVLEVVCKTMREKMDQGLQVVPVSINLSRLDFWTCDIYHKVVAIPEQYHIPAYYIDIEITERALTYDDGHLRGAMENFHAYGFKVWMDDFGSEYSSLNALKDYDFDVLKIDMKFLRVDKTNEKRAHDIVSSIIDMAKRLGIQTLCEGVETQEQFDFLHAAGCEKAQGYLFSKPIPVEKVFPVPIEAEDRMEAAQMNAVGQVNLLAIDPLANNTGNNLPMALYANDGGKFHCLSYNPAFSYFLHQLSFKDPEALSVFLDEENNENAALFDRAAKISAEDQDEVTMDIVLNGDYCTIGLRTIAGSKEGNKYVILIRVNNLSRMVGYQNVSLREQALKYLYSIYDRIDLFNLETRIVEVIYENTSRYRGRYTGERMEDAVRAFALLNVREDEREDFVNLYNPDTILQRIKASGHSFIVCYFHTRDQLGTYKIQSATIVPAVIGGRQCLLSAVSGIEAERADTVEKYIAEKAHTTADMSIPEEILDRMENDEKISAEMLLAGVLENTQLGIFWKDRNRRFLGANKYFMDYYGFTSPADFVGKTDEEVGWHVDPNPYMNDEERVINYGEIIKGAPGMCISHGKDRSIEAYKRPLYDQGRIVGLVGCFVDVTDKKNNVISSDILTGLLDRKGIEEMLWRYRKSYEENKMDFAIIRINIPRFRNFNAKYGYEAACSILLSAAECLVQIAGTKASIGRYDTDRFMILTQYEDSMEVHRLLTNIANALGEMKIASSFEERPMFTISVALYRNMNEADRKELFALADAPDNK